jgi:hypothetical protein
VLEIRELIRRVQLGETDRQIGRDLQVSRKTVRKYRAWAQQHDALTGPLPDPAALHAQLKATLPVSPPPTTPSKVTPFRDQVMALRQRGVECQAIYDILREQHAFTGSYGSVYRFVRHLEPRTPDACVRVETEPGIEAQVDFGYAGLLHDPSTATLRKAWAFVMTLSFSRHSYVELVCLPESQSVDRSARLERELNADAAKMFGVLSLLGSEPRAERARDGRDVHLRSSAGGNVPQHSGWKGAARVGAREPTGRWVFQAARRS